MQDATPEFGAALEGEIVWAQPKLLAGWHGSDTAAAHPESWGLWKDELNRTVVDDWKLVTDPYAALWFSDTPTLLDVVPGNATIAVNVVSSSRGAQYNILDGAGSQYIVDWDMIAVVSANVLPTGAPYAFLFRFSDVPGTDKLELWIWVDITTFGVHFEVLRTSSAGTEHVVASRYVPGLTYTAGKRLGVRMAHVAGLVVVRIWDEDNDQEPDYWMALDQDIRSSFAGVPHVRGYLDVSNTNGTVIFSMHSWRFKDARWLGDLTEQVNNTFQVAHTLDDGFPQAITSSLGGSPQVALTVELTGRVLFGVESDARQYFSPFNYDSPVYGFSRDIASVTLDHGLITANGAERVRLFTGQMTNLPIKDRAAVLEAVSRTRIKLAHGVTAPVVNGPEQGGEFTWLVSYILWVCGVEAAPPPNADTLQVYVPGHGSLRPFVPFPTGDTAYYSRNLPDDTVPVRPTFTDGPFVRAVDSRVSLGVGRMYYLPLIGTRHRLEGVGDHFLTQDHPRGRMEFWLLGVPANPQLQEPPETDTLGTALAYMRLENGVQCAIQLTVDQDRQLHWQMEDFLQPIRRFWTGLTLPADGAWHALGMYYDVSTAAFVVHLDGDERSFTPSPAFDVEDLEEVDDGVSGPSFWSTIPWAEVRVHTGAASTINPALVGWDSTQVRTPGSLLVFEDFEDTSYNITWTGTWVRDSTQFFAGAWSFKSAVITHMGQSAFVLHLPGGVGEVSFRVRLSTELEFDKFQVVDAFLYSSFTSSVSNAWPTPEIGPAFTTLGTASDYSSSGGVGRHSLSSANVERVVYVDTGSDDGRVQVEVSFGVAASTGAPVRIRLRGRGTGADIGNNYYVILELNDAGDVYIGLNKIIAFAATNIVPNTLVGSNGAGSVWRLDFSWSGNQLSATATNVTTPAAPVTISGPVTGITTGQRVYLSSIRAVGNTVATTTTFDNLIINGQPLYGGSGPVNAWHLANLRLRPGMTRLLFQYVRGQTGSGGSDAVWIDNLELRAAPTIDTSWVSQANVHGIEVEFEALVEEGSREGWGWIAELCQSSMTCMRVDENDVVQILPPGYFIAPEQLAVAGTLTTEWNAQDPDITLDPSKIRNSVQVDFEEAVVDTAQALLLEYKTAIEVRPGLRRFLFSLDVPAVDVLDSITVRTTDTPVNSDAVVWVNTAMDGSGSYLPDTQFKARVVEWGSSTALVEFDNRTNSTVWVAHNYQSNTPYLTLAGRGVRIAQASASVQAVQPGRPERTLTVQAPAIQTRDAARGLAASLLVWTSRPRPELLLSVLGDPRRQPGDLYEIADVEGAKVTGQWRAMSIAHSRNGAEYVQAIGLRPILPIALWDDPASGWDEGVWSE
jgi:hypothetical protein